MRNHIKTKPATVFSAVAVSSTTAYQSTVTELSGGEERDMLYTLEGTSTATGSWQLFVNNKTKLEYDADVVSAGSAAANVAGWCAYGAAVSHTAALKTSVQYTNMTAQRCRMQYTNATNSGAITARLSLA